MQVPACVCVSASCGFAKKEVSSHIMRVRQRRKHLPASPLSLINEWASSAEHREPDCGRGEESRGHHVEFKLTKPGHVAYA